MGENFHEFCGITSFRECFSVNFVRMRGSDDIHIVDNPQKLSLC